MSIFLILYHKGNFQDSYKKLFFYCMPVKKSIVLLLLVQLMQGLTIKTSTVLQANNKMYFVNLAEETHRGAVIIDLMDRIQPSWDRTNTSVTYRLSQFLIVADNPGINNLFEIHPETGTIACNRRIDRDSLCDRENLCCPATNQISKTAKLKEPGISTSHFGAYLNKKKSRRTANDCHLNFRVIYKELSVNSNTTNYCIVEINILDINDNAPRFILPKSLAYDNNNQNSETGLQVMSINPKLVAQVWVNEAADPGTCIPLLSVVDDDSVEFGINEYRLEIMPSTEWKTLNVFNDLPISHSTTSAKLPFAIVGNQCDSKSAHYSGSQTYPSIEFTSSPYQYLVTSSDQTPVTTPHLMLLDSLDRESLSEYWVRLLVLDRVQRDIPSAPGQHQFPSDRVRQHTSSLIIRIRVQDTNDNTPEVLSQLTLKVPEDIKVGSLVGTLVGQDRDIGDNGRLEYRLLLDPKKAINFPLKIHPSTGVISINQPLDADRLIELDSTRGQIKFQIVTSDAGQPVARKAITDVNVHIIDLNDESPEIKVIDLGSRSNPARPTVLENQPPEQLIAFVTVTDADAGLHGMVSCHVDNPKFELQLIRSPSSKSFESPSGTAASGGVEYIPNIFEYQLITTISLDRESHKVENLHIICTDQALADSDIKTGQVRLSIQVLDENDNSPVFTPKEMHIKVFENGQVNEWVATFNATDADNQLEENYRSIWDEGGGSSFTGAVHGVGVFAQPYGIKYTLDKTGESYFRVDPSTGMLYTKVTFDREKVARLGFNLTATDMGSPPRNTTLPVVVYILDRNDNAPVFLNSSYEWEVLENLTVGSLIGNVSAKDVDEGVNGAVRYQLEDLKGAAQWVLRLDSKTGQLWLRHALDREKVKVYQFKVRAFDEGLPRQSSECVITIRIKDVNDNAPKFVYPTQKNHTIFASVYANPNNPLLKLTAVDSDEGDNAKLTFHMSGDKSGKNIFHLDEHSGELTLVSTDNPAQHKGNYEVYLKVTDGGDPPLSGYATIYIVLNQTLATYHDQSLATEPGDDSGKPSKYALPYNRGSLDLKVPPDQARPRGMYGYQLFEYTKNNHMGSDKLEGLDKTSLQGSANYNAHIRDFKNDKPPIPLSSLFTSERALVIIVCLVVVLAMVTFLFLIVLTIVRRKSALALANSDQGAAGSFQEQSVGSHEVSGASRLNGKCIKYPNCLIDCSAPLMHPPKLVPTPYSPTYPRHGVVGDVAALPQTSPANMLVSSSTPIKLAPGQWKTAVFVDRETRRMVQPQYQTICGNYGCQSDAASRFLASQTSLVKSNYTDQYYIEAPTSTECQSVPTHPLGQRSSHAVNGVLVDNRTGLEWHTDNSKSVDSFRCPAYCCQTLPANVRLEEDANEWKGPQEDPIWSRDETRMDVKLVDPITSNMNKPIQLHRVKFQPENNNLANSGYQDLRFLNSSYPATLSEHSVSECFEFVPKMTHTIDNELTTTNQRGQEDSEPVASLPGGKDTSKTSWKT